MSKLREFAKKIPLLPYLYSLCKRYKRHQLEAKNAEEVFTDIYNNNAWNGVDSISGPGSDTSQTGIIVNELSTTLREYDVSTMLDIPCGDFHWMKNVDLTDVEYIGADIVNNLIEKNAAQYVGAGLSFKKMNLLEDKLPKVDLILCRDCLVHFSFQNIFHALENICASESKYLLATTFTERTENQDIATGQWRTLNLEIAPISLPTPLKIIEEGCNEEGGSFADKALVLWRIADIRESLN